MRVLKNLLPLIVFYALSALFIFFDPEALNVFLWVLRIVIGIVVGLTLVLVFVIVDLLALGGVTKRNFFKMDVKNKQDE